MKAKALSLICLMSVLAVGSHNAVQAADETKVSPGQQVTSSEGARLGQVYRVTSDGSAQIILDGKMITIPASTLTARSGGGVTTSLKKSEVLALKR